MGYKPGRNKVNREITCNEEAKTSNWVQSNPFK